MDGIRQSSGSSTNSSLFLFGKPTHITCNTDERDRTNTNWTHSFSSSLEVKDAGLGSTRIYELSGRGTNNVSTNDFTSSVPVVVGAFSRICMKCMVWHGMAWKLGLRYSNKRHLVKQRITSCLSISLLHTFSPSLLFAISAI
jgi:hypothetical protein